MKPLLEAGCIASIHIPRPKHVPWPSPKSDGRAPTCLCHQTQRSPQTQRVEQLCVDPERHAAGRPAGEGDQRPSTQLTSRSVSPHSLPAPAPHGPAPEVTGTDRSSRGSPPPPVRGVRLSEQRGWGGPSCLPPCTRPKPKRSHHGHGVSEPRRGRASSPNGAAALSPSSHHVAPGTIPWKRSMAEQREESLTYRPQN